MRHTLASASPTVASNAFSHAPASNHLFSFRLPPPPPLRTGSCAHVQQHRCRFPLAAAAWHYPPHSEFRRLDCPILAGSMCCCCCCCRFSSFLRQCQIQRCKVLQPMLPVPSQAQWCRSEQKLQQRYDAAMLSILAQRVDHGEKLGGGWSSVCNMSLLQPCNQPPRSTLSLCPWCMRLASASIRSLPAHTLTHLTLPYASHV